MEYEGNPAHVGQTKAYKIIIMLSTASTPLVLLACLVLIVAQDAPNTNQESPTIPIEDKGFQEEDHKHDIDGISRVMELTDIQFQEVLDKSINASSYVFAKFWAPWCPFSTLLHPLFDAISPVFPNVTFVSVDTSKFYGVNSRWGIVAFPTLILFGKGDYIAKCNNRSLEGMSKFLSDRTKNTLSRRDTDPALALIFSVSPSTLPPNLTVANPPTVQSILHEHFGHHVYLYFAIAFLLFRLGVHYMQKRIQRDSQRLKYD